MNKMRIIYPNYEIKQSPHKIEGITYIRKKAEDGRWYKMLMYQSLHKHDNMTTIDEGIYVSQLLSKLHCQAYFYIMCGIVNLDLRTLDGDFLFTLDEEQYDEETRILALANHISIEEAQQILDKRKEPKYPLNYYMNYE